MSGQNVGLQTAGGFATERHQPNPIKADRNDKVKAAGYQNRPAAPRHKSTRIARISGCAGLVKVSDKIEAVRFRESDLTQNLDGLGCEAKKHRTGFVHGPPAELFGCDGDGFVADGGWGGEPRQGDEVSVWEGLHVQGLVDAGPGCDQAGGRMRRGGDFR